MAYTLKVVGGVSEGRAFRVSADELTIGRVESNMLVVFSPGVSRQHAVIRKDGGEYRVVDLGSSNGTILNGVPARNELLKDGDLLVIGPASLRFNLVAGDGFAREDTKITVLPKPAGRGAALARAFPLKIAAAAAVVIAAAAAAIWLFATMGAKGGLSQDRSDAVFPLNAANYEKKFGYGKVDVQCMNHCSFSFNYGDGRAVLYYAAGDAANRDEVEIMVNGQRAGFAPRSPGGWVRGLHLAMPASALKKGSENRVTFSNKRNPRARAPWAVAFVKVVEEPLPAANMEKARELLELAYKKYAEKDVAPGNLYQSLDYLRRSRDYMERMEPKPELYSEASRRIDLISAELQEQFDKYMFSVQKAVQFGDKGKAAETLGKILLVFPDADDQRHQEASQALQALKE